MRGPKESEVVLSAPRLTVTIGAHSGTSDNSGIVEIQVDDDVTAMTVLRLEIKSDAFLRALGRQAWVECEKAVVYGVDRLGKKHQCKTFEFPLGIKTKPLFHENKQEHAKAVVQECCPEGWTPDLYFGSQDSFFSRGEESWARCVIRRWVPMDTPDLEPPETVEDKPSLKKPRRKK